MIWAEPHQVQSSISNSQIGDWDQKYDLKLIQNGGVIFVWQWYSRHKVGRQSIRNFALICQLDILKCNNPFLHLSGEVWRVYFCLCFKIEKIFDSIKFVKLYLLTILRLWAGNLVVKIRKIRTATGHWTTDISAIDGLFLISRAVSLHETWIWISYA